VFGAIAHFERRLIAERIKDGIAAARARGKKPGRQPLDADKVQAALRLVESGLSPTKAAVQLDAGTLSLFLLRSALVSVAQRADVALSYCVGFLFRCYSEPK